ncbi:MAG: DUF5610 domain-containing protein [Gammaproteobacteria bacterium]|nr:DUF5610 domain-containing protein [Gammaproteobacteria bacterium]
MDIQSSTHPSTHLGGRTLLYPTLSRSHHAAAPVASADTTNINATQRTALDILRARLAESGVTLPEAADPNEFSPERVAGRILDFVGLAVERAAPGEQEHVLAEARKGVEQGFREARDILQSLDVLKGDIAANVDATYDRVMQGLDELAGNAPAAGTEVQRARVKTAACLAWRVRRISRHRSVTASKANWTRRSKPPSSICCAASTRSPTDFSPAMCRQPFSRPAI